jgi:uncharacterized protein (TIGR02145 family)
VAVSATLSALLASPGHSQPAGNAPAAVMNANCSGAANVTDGEGNLYSTVRIDNRCWMREDLGATKFRNGDAIPTAAGAAQWSAGWQGPLLAKRNHAHGSVFLYNFRAVRDARGICPVDWRIPSDVEWRALRGFLGLQTAGRKMKSIMVRTPDVYGWNVPNLADNTSGFSGLPAGRRDQAGAFTGLYSFGNWWSSYERPPNLGGAASVKHNTTVMSFNGMHQGNGFAVRCLRVAPEG